MRPTPSEELWACRSIGAHLGRPVVVHDDGSEPSMYDLRVGPVDAPEIAIEVTTAVDPAWRATWNTGKSSMVNFEGLEYDWLLHVSSSASFNRLRREFLAIEARAVASGRKAVANFGRNDPDLASRLRALGVEFAIRSDEPGAGEVLIAMDANDGRPSIEPIDATGAALVEWASGFVAEPRRADNLSKLRGSGAPDRELFVVVDMAGAPWPGYAYITGHTHGSFRLPVVAPDLPDEITALWLVAGAPMRDVPGIRWVDGGWEAFDPDP